ncbi:Zinc transport protein ZntB [Roseivivax jejudonensis]|uniref:Zinc transport protein ZntB n=1 Tax=Roseivivax jejudonensis TaxID=1529041 RepID=A0A1X6Z8R0_9RHOB|nr:CorA family divalent cation transporter [Roseivivax jejudonensis]SLN42125.1 Zinc transport protein ZntB [Roseivivax jejudonensis]
MTPIFAYDIDADGGPTRVDDLSAPVSGAYRWIHADFTHAGTGEWLFAHLPERAAEILSQPETRPRALAHAGGLIVILRGLNLDPAADDPEDMVALRLWVAPGLVVSVRRRLVRAAQDLGDAAAAGRAPASPQMLLVALATHFTDRIERHGVALEDRVDDLEDTLFADDRHPDRKALPESRTASIRLHRFLSPQAAALGALTDPRLPVIDDEAREDLSELADRAQRAVEEVSAVRDRLGALTEHVDMRQTARLSRNSYALSIVAAIFLPMSFLTGLFGVNVAGMPGTGTPAAFALLTLASLGLGALVYLVLRAMRLF